MHRYMLRLLWARYRRRYGTPPVSWSGAERLIDLHKTRDQYWQKSRFDWWVLSEDGEKVYRVQLRWTGPECDCAAHQLGGMVMCKHVVAVLAWARWNS